MARLPIIAILAAGIGVSGIGPAPAVALDYLVFVSGDCGSAASRVLDETGGTLLSAEPQSDGRTCKVIVLIQGKGERPRKVTRTVPM